jgi:hypothetical protein
LHRSKDAAYGNSWKKRGELISIAANLARKVDRIEQVVDGAATGRETLLDTAVDLLVYAVKYETFLADQSAEVAAQIFANGGERFSDGPEGFEELLRALDVVDGVGTALAASADASAAFDDLDTYLQLHPRGEWMSKLALAERLATIALQLVLAIAASSPREVDTLRRDSGLR